MPRKPKVYGECAYCTNPGTTKDHIPPQTIYAKGTQNKPWVPACRDCNKEASLDDEYVQRLAMLCGAVESKDVAETEERFMRSLQREDSKGLQAEVLGSLSPLSPEDELRYPGGIYIGLQGRRLGRITDKLVRGWWYKLTNGHKINSAYSIMKYALGQNRQPNDLYDFNEAEIGKCPGFFSGDHAFSMQMAYDPGSQLTCWRFVFFQTFGIMAYTCLEHEETFDILDLRKPYSVIDYGD